MIIWPVRILAPLIFLFSIVFTIPLAFDIGGRTCGLAFSLSLAVYYFIYSIFSIIISNRTRVGRTALGLLNISQWLVMPILMIWSLNRFSIDANSTTWVERTFSFKRATNATLLQWLFGHEGVVERISVRGWDKLLRWSVPVFQLVEGFCSLLVIQAAGQITKHTVNKDGGDNWMVSDNFQRPVFWSKANRVDCTSRTVSLHHL